MTREVKHYSLQMIIAVGFNVNNERAVHFRKWANAILQDNGKISAELAQIKAETEFEKYCVVQDQLYQSDFYKFTLPKLLFDKSEEYENN